MTHDLLLSQALDGFYMARRADGYSPDTIDQYSWALSRWLAFIGDKPVQEIQAQDARAFLAQLHGLGRLSPASIFHTWKAIRAFWKWAAPELDLPRVMDNVKQPAYQHKEITPLSSADIERLLSAAVKITADNLSGAYEYKHPQADRNRLVLLVLLDTGVRVGECARLNVQDINMDTCEVIVRPFRSSVKSRPRTVYIGKRTQKELWKYLLGREPAKNDPLFLSASGRRMTADSIKHLVRRISQRAGVPAHPHMLRHTFAIEYLRNNGDVFTLQRLLGHSSLDMTRKYLALAQADLEAAHRRASPVDNWRL
jgi:integrase/recombinase XerD